MQLLPYYVTIHTHIYSCGINLDTDFENEVIPKILKRYPFTISCFVNEILNNV